MSMHHRTTTQPTDVYRVYDQDERLLYVGISVNGYSRLKTHRLYAPWWPRAHRVTVELYPTRRDAELIEADAIENEHPIHNTTRNYSIGREATVRPAAIERDEWVIH